MDLPEIVFPEGVYADVRVERLATTRISLRDGRIDNVSPRLVIGAFLRVLKGGRWYYASTTDLEGISARLAELAEGLLPDLPDAVDPTPLLEVHRACDLPFADCGFEDVPLEDKIALVRALAPAVDRPTIRTWTATWDDWHRERRFVSSRGADVTHDAQLGGCAFHLSFAEDGRTFSDRWSQSATRFDALTSDPAGLLTQVQRCERFLREAEAIEPGDYTVVLHPRVAGVFAHESFGHKSEADFMLGDPSMMEEWAIGRKVGSDMLSIVDDGTMPGSGYVPWDDEGQPARRTWLIRQGRLAGRLHSAPTAAALGEGVTGNARAVDHTFEPIVRMTATWIEPGTSTRDELFASVDDGLYIETFAHGSGMSIFTIAPRMAWRIRDGKLAEPVKVAVITGSVFETLGLIDGLSDTVELDSAFLGGCGKMAQVPLPVAFGGPYVRCSRMHAA